MLDLLHNCDCSLCGLSDLTFISKIPLQIRFVCRCTHLLKEDLASLVQLVSHSAVRNYIIALLVKLSVTAPSQALLQGMAIVQSVGCLTGEQEVIGQDQN